MMDSNEVLEILAREFPGLVDGETEVSGADLIERLSELMMVWNLEKNQ